MPPRRTGMHKYLTFVEPISNKGMVTSLIPRGVTDVELPLFLEVH